MANAVDVPVFMSSLLQVPFAQQVIGPKKRLEFFVLKRFMTEVHLSNVGIDLDSNFIVAGAQDEYGCPEFDNLWDHEKRPTVPEAYYDKASADLLAAAKNFVSKNPSIGAVLLECTGMQMFARSIQREINLPVWSWGTLLDYAYGVVAHPGYYGHV